MFDYQAAVEAGLSPDDISSFLQSNPVEVINQSNQPTSNTQPSSKKQTFEPEIESQLALVPPAQQKNMREVAKALQDEGILNPNVLAYTLGTIKHETGDTFSPIEEFGGRDQAMKLGYEGGPDFFGRGYIQLTHKGNYKQMGDRIGVKDLAEHPEKALDPVNAAKIAAAFIKDRGVAEKAQSGDFIGARGPINGTDQADTIAKYAQEFQPKTQAPTPSMSQPTMIPSPVAPLAQPSPPVPGMAPTPQPKELLNNYIQKNIPDVVDPFRQPETTKVTQYMHENPNELRYGEEGHQGVDLINSNPAVTNPIGGLNISGNQPGGYGNYNVVVGANPEELKQMDPTQKSDIITRVKSYIDNGASDLRGLDLPGKNISIQGHLANPASNDPEIATGSANLTMGGSGGVAPHLHQEMKDTMGEPLDIQKVLGSYPKNEGNYGPNIDFNKMATEQIKKRLGKK